MKWLDELNDEQRSAVESGDGPLLIIAGPGTGKTKTLTARIAYLLTSEHARPEEILALTFTNKAAREMQERVRPLLGDQPTPKISTFHALAASLLPTDDLKLISEAERQVVVKAFKPKLPTRDALLAISKAKNQMDTLDPEFVELVAAYNAELAKQGLYDFDDLLLKLHKYLQDHRTNYSYILVDEFQDTNDLQYELLKLLNTSDNLFVIGDPLQSIYGFRGANSQVFERFTRDWPATNQIRLSVNYRSTPGIIEASSTIFPDQPALRPNRSSAGKVKVIETLNEYGEADWVINEIEAQLGGSDMLKSSEHHASASQRTFADFAVLYRTHAVAKTLQRGLENSGIPYQVAGEGSPYLQPPIMAITKALTELAGKRYAPTRGIADLVEDIITSQNIRTEKNALLLRQFTNTLQRFENKSLAEYVDHLQEMAEQEYYDPTADAVTLLTIHAAKGLEFSQVFLIAAEQGVLPLARNEIVADIEEERRLFYVAVTRAKDDLYITHARNRAKQPHTVSEFVSALPKKLVEFTIDPNIAEQLTKIKKRQQRRSQTSLF